MHAWVKIAILQHNKIVALIFECNSKLITYDVYTGFATVVFAVNELTCQALKTDDSQCFGDAWLSFCSTAVMCSPICRSNIFVCYYKMMA